MTHPTTTGAISRRAALTGGLAVTAAAAVGWQAAPQARADTDLPSHLVRACQAYDALQHRLGAKSQERF